MDNPGEDCPRNYYPAIKINIKLISAERVKLLLTESPYISLITNDIVAENNFFTHNQCLLA
jgi:hypothetical protein